MSYCGNCGTQIGEGQSFCASCGTSVDATTPTAQSSTDATVSAKTSAQQRSEATLQKLATLKAQAQTPAKSSGRKVLIGVLAVLLVGGIAAVAGVVYVGYRVKQKASAALDNLEAKSDTRKATGQAGSDDQNRSNRQTSDDGSPGGDTENPLAGVLDKLQGSDGASSPMGNMAKSILEDTGVRNPEMPADLVRNMPYSTLLTPLPCPTSGGQIDAAALAGGRIQIKPEAVLTTSWTVPAGDLEETDTINSISPDNLDFQSDGPTRPRMGEQGQLGHATLANKVCGKDVAEGETFSTGWVFNSDDKAPGLYPGVSRILLPIKQVQTLAASGMLPMVFGYYDYMDALTEWELLAWKGTLKRVEPKDVAFPLIINDQLVNVPAIHVQGSMKVIETGGRFGARDQPTDAYILDDPAVPVVLSWMFGEDLHQDDAFRVRFIKVTYPSMLKPTIEQQLAKDRKAITWGINFDFNSDTIRPVSEPVLKEIAQAMANKPNWKLIITGHTDNIGGHKYNMELSQRRSAAVKKALVERYHVDPNRLSTSGDGDSAPIDTNDTLEGRARNRRVELTLD